MKKNNKKRPSEKEVEESTLRTILGLRSKKKKEKTPKEDFTCDYCGGTGKAEGGTCPDCYGVGKY